MESNVSRSNETFCQNFLSSRQRLGVATEGEVALILFQISIMPHTHAGPEALRVSKDCEICDTVDTDELLFNKNAGGMAWVSMFSMVSC